MALQTAVRVHWSLLSLLWAMAMIFVFYAAIRHQAVPTGAATTQPGTSDEPTSGRSIAVDFDGLRALRHVQALVDIGPRSCASPGHARAIEAIVSTLKACRLQPQLQAFTAQTPDGTVRMTNILATIGPPLPEAATAQSPTERDTIVLAAHYDTKRLPFRFVGANDGGSGTAALLELGRVFAARPAKRRVVLVFFDGEEAFRNWTSTDSLYGSRYFAEDWRARNVLPRLRALILMDMIGYKDLHFMRELNNSRWLENRLWRQAAAQGHAPIFTDDTIAVEDDHIPFLRLGVPAADLIDMQYGPNGTNAYWHTAQDTLDKISAESLEVVGRVVEATTREL